MPVGIRCLQTVGAALAVLALGAGAGWGADDAQEKGYSTPSTQCSEGDAMTGPLFLLFGALFGFVLSRGRVTDTIAAMFRLAEFHLFGVIGGAIGTAALGLWLLRRGGNRTLAGAPIELRRKPWQRGAIWGGLILGAGWALSGAGPGTSLVQVGEGKLVALFTVAGILAGTYLYGAVRSAQAPVGGSPGVRAPARS